MIMEKDNKNIVSISPEIIDGRLIEMVKTIKSNSESSFIEVFSKIIKNAKLRYQLSKQMQENLQNEFDPDIKDHAFYVRSNAMSKARGSCFYFCKRNADESEPNVSQAEKEQIFHLTIHIVPGINPITGEVLSIQDRKRLSAIHLRDPVLGVERKLNLFPKLMRRIIDKNDPTTDKYFIQLEGIILPGAPHHALARVYGPTITKSINSFLLTRHIPLNGIPKNLHRVTNVPRRWKITTKRKMKNTIKTRKMKLKKILGKPI